MSILFAHIGNQKNFTRDRFVSILDDVIEFPRQRKIVVSSEDFYICFLDNARSESASVVGIHRSSDLVIAYDASIYNTTELESNLGLGRDVELDILIRELYTRYGVNFINHIKGNFSIVIIDKKSSKVALYKDRFGIKSLFYKVDFGRGLLLTNSLKVFSRLRLPETRLNRSYVLNTLDNLKQDLKMTGYVGLNRVLPAHYIILSLNDMSIISETKYWKLDPNRSVRYRQSYDFVEQFIHLLKQAVSRCVSSSSHIGLELSGGLDSSGVAAYVMEIEKSRNIPVTSFSHVLPEHAKGDIYPYNDESTYIDSVSSFLEIERNIRISESDGLSYIDVLDKAIRTSGLCEYDATGQRELMAAANKEGVDVILSGFLGDELVSSFCKDGYLEFLAEGKYLKFLRKSNSIAGKRRTLQMLLFKFFPGLMRLYINSSLFGIESLNHAKSGSFYHSGSSIDYNKTQSYLGYAMTFRESQVQLIERHHTYLRIESENLAAKEYGIEYQYPLADQDLLEFVLSVPLNQKVNKDVSRLLYRKSLEGRLPKTIINRPSKFGSTRPFWYIDYVNQYDDLTRWLDTFSVGERYKPILIEKLKKKANITLNIGLKSAEMKDSAWGHRQWLAHKILRYLELNPDETLN